MLDQEEVDKIEENWSKFGMLVSKISNTQTKETLDKLCEDLKDRIPIAPASTRLDYHGCYPGGLVESSLETARLMNGLRKLYDAENVSTDSIILCGLFHHLGKIGNEHKALYVEETSKWHNDRGMMYQYDKQLIVTPVSVRSLWWLNQYNIKMSEDEISAFHSMADLGASTRDTNALYNVSMLSLILQQAYRGACIKNSNRTSVVT